MLECPHQVELPVVVSEGVVQWQSAACPLVRRGRDGLVITPQAPLIPLEKIYKFELNSKF